MVSRRRGADRACGRPRPAGSAPRPTRNRGGAKGTRTPNPLLAKQVRYQLRHGPWLRAGQERVTLSVASAQSACSRWPALAFRWRTRRRPRRGRRARSSSSPGFLSVCDRRLYQPARAVLAWDRCGPGTAKPGTTFVNIPRRARGRVTLGIPGGSADADQTSRDGRGASRRRVRRGAPDPRSERPGGAAAQQPRPAAGRGAGRRAAARSPRAVRTTSAGAPGGGCRPARRRGPPARWCGATTRSSSAARCRSRRWPTSASCCSRWSRRSGW